MKNTLLLTLAIVSVFVGYCPALAESAPYKHPLDLSITIDPKSDETDPVIVLIWKNTSGDWISCDLSDQSLPFTLKVWSKPAGGVKLTEYGTYLADLAAGREPKGIWAWVGSEEATRIIAPGGVVMREAKIAEQYELLDSAQNQMVYKAQIVTRGLHPSCSPSAETWEERTEMMKRGPVKRPSEREKLTRLKAAGQYQAVESNVISFRYEKAD